MSKKEGDLKEFLTGISRFFAFFFFAMVAMAMSKVAGGVFCGMVVYDWYKK